MHVILGILGTIVTILYLIRDIEGLGWNPFRSARSKKWTQEYNTDPAFTINDPRQSTACLMYLMAKCSGDISKEQKQCMLDLFRNEFRLDESRAAELLASCSFLMKDPDQVIDNLQEFLKPSINSFDMEKRKSAMELIQVVADCEGRASSRQVGFSNQVKRLIWDTAQPDHKWA